MNLKEILNHRTHCIICSQKMEFEVAYNANLNIDIHDGGLRISSGHNNGIRMLFGFDGKYQRGKKSYKIYKESIRLVKYCKQCRSSSYKGTTQLLLPLSRASTLNPKPVIILKSRSIGATTVSTALNNFTSLNNMKNKECSYTFMLTGDAEGNYDGGLLWEEARYHDDKSFWHVDTSYVSKSSNLTHSSFEGAIGDVMTLQIPAPVNLKNVENIDQFLSKFKMMMLLS